MTDRFSIRYGKAADLVRVMELERQIAEAPHWPETEYRTLVQEQASGVHRALFIAEETASGTLAGFAVGKVIPSAGLAELESIVVGAQARRCGLGRSLCQAVAEWCRAARAEVLELEVRASNAGAIALYEGLGFAVGGRRSGYYEDPPEDALLMKLKLKGDE